MRVTVYVYVCVCMHASVWVCRMLCSPWMLMVVRAAFPGIGVSMPVVVIQKISEVNCLVVYQSFSVLSSMLSYVVYAVVFFYY